MLVGRDAERRAIGAALAGARVGDSRVLVLSGEPGIGKSALLAEAETLVGDMRVLRAQGVESEQLVPFAGLLQLLRPVLGLLEQVPAPQAAALSSALLLGAELDTRPSRFAVGAATLSLLARAAEDAPLAVLVDDAHLLDSPSAQALAFAARRLVSDAVAVLVAVRTGEAGAVPWTALPTLEVTGLSLEAAGELVTGALGPVRRERLVQLHRATAGNPLGLLELGPQTDGADAAPDGAPVAVSEQVARSFLGRARDLGEDARAALLVAAADGAGADTVRAACDRLGVDPRGLTDAQDAGLVSIEGGRVVFRHPLVRSAVYGAADPGTRRSVHRALAAVVPPEETDRLAWHLAEGAVAPDETTALTLDEVAAQASRRGAHAIAAHAYERAARLTATPERLAHRLAAAGEAAWLAGLTERAMTLLDRALASRPDAGLRAHIQELRGAVETRSGSLEKAFAMLLEAGLTVQDTDPDRATRLFADAVHVAFYLGRPASAMQACRAIEGLDGVTTDPGTRYLGSVATGMALVLDGSGARGVERLRGAAYPLVVADEDGGDEFRLPLRVQGALWLRDSGPHRALVTDAIESLRQQAALGSLPYLLFHIGRDAATTDRWDDAEAAYLEAIRLARETGQSTDLAVSLAGLAMLEARRGDTERCLEHVASAVELCRGHHIRLGELWAEFALGDLAAGRGDLTAAVGHYETLEAVLRDTGLSDPDQSCAPELVEGYVHLGRADEARAVAERFCAAAVAKGQPWSMARAERGAALCAPDGSAEQHFETARELQARTPDRFEQARTDLAFGAWLRRDRRRQQARLVLRSALATFDELGAAPWADKAARELGATGETAQRRPSSAMDELTSQERQIAQLLAQGRTTREAAAALFISPKTVEYHLRHVYLKLDIRTRAALAERFGG